MDGNLIIDSVIVLVPHLDDADEKVKLCLRVVQVSFELVGAEFKGSAFHFRVVEVLAP